MHQRYLLVALFSLLLASTTFSPVRAQSNPPLAGDALFPPIPERVGRASSTDAGTIRYQPSAFLAGKVAVRVVLVESNGGIDAST